MLKSAAVTTTAVLFFLFLPLVAMTIFFFDAAHLNNHAPRQSQDHVLCEMMRAIRTCGEAWHGDMRSRFSEALHEYFVCS